jgi:ribosomal protein S27E
MTRVEEGVVETGKPSTGFTPPSESAEKRRVGCASCGHTLLELFAEADSKVWLKVKCGGCRKFSVILYRDTKVQVTQL